MLSILKRIATIFEAGMFHIKEDLKKLIKLRFSLDQDIQF